MDETTGGGSPPGLRSISYSRLVDLTHVIHPGIPLWPGDPPVEFNEVAQLDTHGFYLRRFAMGEHGGTHMNAPRSFDAQGAGIDAYTPDELVVPAIVIDFRSQAATDSDTSLSPGDILAWEKQYGLVPAGSLALLNTGW